MCPAVVTVAVRMVVRAGKNMVSSVGCLHVMLGACGLVVIGGEGYQNRAWMIGLVHGSDVRPWRVLVDVERVLLVSRAGRGPGLPT